MSVYIYRKVPNPNMTDDAKKKAKKVVLGLIERLAVDAPEALFAEFNKH